MLSFIQRSKFSISRNNPARAVVVNFSVRKAAVSNALLPIIGEPQTTRREAIKKVIPNYKSTRIIFILQPILGVGLY